MSINSYRSNGDSSTHSSVPLNLSVPSCEAGQTNIRILIVDDSKTVRQMLQVSLEDQLDMEVVGTAADGTAGLEKLAELQPDVALVDVDMPGLNGCEVVRIATQKFPSIKLIMLTTLDSVDVVSEALERGAKGYLLKTASENDLLGAIRSVTQGYLQLSPTMLEKMLEVGKDIDTISNNANSSLVRLVHNDEPALLPPAEHDDFLPPIGKWTTIGGFFLLAVFVSAVGLSAILPYTVTVQTFAKVRPRGDLRVVQATAEGRIEQIDIRENQQVETGDVILEIDDAQLLTRQRQLETSLERGQEQLKRLDSQLETINGQIAAQTDSYEREVAAYVAELDIARSEHRERQLVSQADLNAVEAEVTLAREEYQRFLALEETGGVSQLQVIEREAAYNAALARLERAKASLNPNEATVNRASERLAQIRSSNIAAVAALNREKESLLQQYLELEEQLLQEEDDLSQVESDLQNTVVRAPVSGVIQQLNVRNVDQVLGKGDEIARIAPTGVELIIEAYVASRDINSIALGQTAQMRVSSCPYTDFGTLRGTVSTISPDATVLDTPSNTPANRTPNSLNGYYKVFIEHSTDEMTSSNRRCLIQSGMDGRLDIETNRETILVFILRKARLLMQV